MSSPCASRREGCAVRICTWPRGTPSIAGVHLSDIPALNYARHLFQERTMRSVASNTGQDGRKLFGLAKSARPRVAVSRYARDDADRAPADLAGDPVTGVAVLVV
jgi:alcohol dehydrogenase, propanol-preferring